MNTLWLIANLIKFLSSTLLQRDFSCTTSPKMVQHQNPKYCLCCRLPKTAKLPPASANIFALLFSTKVQRHVRRRFACKNKSVSKANTKFCRSAEKRFGNCGISCSRKHVDEAVPSISAFEKHFLDNCHSDAVVVMQIVQITKPMALQLIRGCQLIKPSMREQSSVISIAEISRR